jgi:hypothetical protein
MPQGAGVSDDPRDYASLVLYHAAHSGPSLRLRELLLPYADVIFQDAASIPPERRPSWLVGVPTAVELPSYRVHTGTAAVRYVEDWVERQVRCLESAAVASARLPAAPLESAFGELPVVDEDRYRDTKAEEAAGGRTLEELMRLRQQGQQPPPQ